MRTRIHTLAQQENRQSISEHYKVEPNHTAIELADSILYDYEIWTEELVTTSGLQLNHKAIVRKALQEEDEQENVVLGVVGKDYELINPRDICQVHTATVPSKVDGMGLFHGKIFFIQSLIGEYVIGDKADNDRVRTYLMYDAPMDGNGALSLRNVHNRSVCINTFFDNRVHASESHTIRHGKNAIEDMIAWSNKMVERQNILMVANETFLNQLTEETLTTESFAKLVNLVLPLPNYGTLLTLDDSGLAQSFDPLAFPDKFGEEAIKEHNNNVIKQKRMRKLAMELWQGKLTGGHYDHIQSNLYRAFNVFTELFSWVNLRGGAVPHTKAVLLGGRGDNLVNVRQVFEDYLKGEFSLDDVELPDNDSVFVIDPSQEIIDQIEELELDI